MISQKNATGSPAPTPQQPLVGSGGIGSMPSSQYLSKQALVLKFGARGSQPGFFTWPRGIAVGPDNTVVVADSSNHRVQIFDEQGQNRFWLGGYGNGEGEFDCLAGVAVNRIGQFIIADRYNHRIQIFDPSGHFLRAFGSQGSTDGKFNYPWGICTDALGFIYVCDKENHRIQVWQHGRQARAARTPALHRRQQHQQGDRVRLQQSQTADFRCQWESSDHIRVRGYGGGTVQVSKGRCCRRAGIYLCGGFRKQQNPDFQS